MTETKIILLVLGFLLGQLTYLAWLHFYDWWLYDRNRPTPNPPPLPIHLITGITENQGGVL